MWVRTKLQYRPFVELALTLIVGGICLALTAGIAGLGLSHAAKAIGAYAVFGLAVTTALYRAFPVAALGAANRVTLLRAALACLFAGLVGEGARVVAELAVPMVVGTAVFLALDGVDGWLARRRGEESVFGRFLDHETDALFFLVLSILVHQTEKVGPWIITAGLLHYVYLAACLACPRLSADMPPTRRGQAVGLGAVLGLLACLFPDVQAEVATGVSVAVLSALVWSFIVDVFRLLHMTSSAHGREVPGGKAGNSQ